MRILLLLLLVLAPVLAQAEQQVVCHKVTAPPLVDGNGSDATWHQAKPVLINDQTANETILLSSVYTDERIYFLVQYPDKAENSLHEPWMWDAAQQRYVEGPHREDTFVFKWNMMGHDVNLSAFSDDDYRADIWYWKVNRSNLAGYADDKMQILSGREPHLARDDSAGEADEVKSLRSFSGKKRYLERVVDSGAAPYREVAAPKSEGAPLLIHFEPAQPSGSRADVTARGRWDNGFWFIEFSRKLQTGHDDDVQFDPGHEYLFGVSIFSLYGNNFDVSTPNLYGMGRISEPLRLKFE